MTLLLFPFPAELQGFSGGWVGLREKVISGYKAFTLNDRPDWTLVVCGQGKVEAALATAILGEALRPTMVFLIGSATALTAELPPGEIVAGFESLEIDFGSGGSPPGFSATWEPTASRLTGLISGRILSADADLFDPAEKKRLGGKYQAQAYAWEGAGFYRALKKTGLKGLEIRVITESVGESRLPLPELQARIKKHFPRLREVILLWEAGLSSIG